MGKGTGGSPWPGQAASKEHTIKGLILFKLGKCLNSQTGWESKAVELQEEEEKRKDSLQKFLLEGNVPYQVSSSPWVTPFPVWVSRISCPKGPRKRDFSLSGTSESSCPAQSLGGVCSGSAFDPHKAAAGGAEAERGRY